MSASVRPLQDVLVEMPDSFAKTDKSRHRPLTIWGVLRDRTSGEGKIAAGFLRTTNIAGPSNERAGHVPVAALLMAGRDLRALLNASKDVVLSPAELHMLPNNVSFFKRDVYAPRKADPIVLPDIVLRRVIGLVHYRWPLDQGSFWAREKTNELVWDGPVLEGLTHDDIHKSFSWQPDLADSNIDVSHAYESMIPRDEIARIVQIAKNYYDYCVQKRLPIILPRPGTYYDWPDGLLKFETPQNGDVELDWVSDVKTWQAEVFRSHLRKKHRFSKSAPL